MVAFASNSLLCRLALRPGSIDPASFAAVRIAAGAAMLLLLNLPRRPLRGIAAAGSWRSAAALAAYAVLFAFAYLALDAGTGTLALFGAVQLTMIGVGLARGERPHWRSWLGFAAAVGGLLVLLLPTLGTPSLGGLGAMTGAGVAWGVYSLRGRGAADPTLATAGNFVVATPLSAIALLWPLGRGALYVEPSGLLLALASGAITSGLGYVLWYAALRGLSATTAAMAQLSVPILAAIGGIALLGERPQLRLAVASALVLGGVAMAMSAPRRLAARAAS